MAVDPEKYINTGRLMVLQDDPAWKDDIKKANKHKNGHPFMYSDALFAHLGVIKSITGMSYANLEGVCRQSLGDEFALRHSIIHRRINNMKITFNKSKIARVVTAGGKTIRIAIDSSGMTPYKRGESIQAKWHVSRGFVKLHITTDANTGLILSAKLTDDSKGSGDAAQMEELLDDALENLDIQQDDSSNACPDQEVELLGDGAYGNRGNVTTCIERDITPILRGPVSSTTKAKGHAGWGDLVRSQFGDLSPTGKMYVNSLTKEEKYANQKRWMKDTGYGVRWRVEGVFSSIKRIQGEALWSRKVDTMKQEIRLRVATHNMLTLMGVHA